MGYGTGRNGQEDSALQSWQVKEANARFNELMNDLAEDGPRMMTLRGRRVSIELEDVDHSTASSGERGD